MGKRHLDASWSRANHMVMDAHYETETETETASWQTSLESRESWELKLVSWLGWRLRVAQHLAS